MESLPVAACHLPPMKNSRYVFVLEVVAVILAIIALFSNQPPSVALYVSNSAKPRRPNRQRFTFAPNCSLRVSGLKCDVAMMTIEDQTAWCVKRVLDLLADLAPSVVHYCAVVWDGF